MHIRPGAAHFAGVKLTGTDLYAVVTDLSATVVAAHDEPLRSTEPDAVAEQIASVPNEMLAGFGLAGALGVCLAGDVMDRDAVQLVERSNFLGGAAPRCARWSARGSCRSRSATTWSP